MKILENLGLSGHAARPRQARRFAFVGAGIAAAVAGLASVALATSPSGIVSSAILVRASFADSVDVKFKIEGDGQEVVHAPNLQETVIQQIILGPGGSTGWHSHPGPAVAMIKSGSLSLYSSDDPTCTPRTYSAGEAFVDSGQGHVHLARNLSLSENVEVWVTYFDVPPGEPVRLDSANPGKCEF